MIKKSKVILFASLIVVTILVLSFVSIDGMDSNDNIKDLMELPVNQLTEEQELKLLNDIVNEKHLLEDKIHRLNNAEDLVENTDALIVAQKRMDELIQKLDDMQTKANKVDIPKVILEKMMSQQSQFEEKLEKSDLLQFVTSVGIDLGTKEIQVSLNEDKVAPSEVDSIVDQLDNLMPKDAKWHVVLSDTIIPMDCSSGKCSQILE